jgi:hypothetical protein
LAPAAAAGAAGPGASHADDGVVDAEFEDVSGEKS